MARRVAQLETIKARPSGSVAWPEGKKKSMFVNKFRYVPRYFRAKKSRCKVV